MARPMVVVVLSGGMDSVTLALWCQSLEYDTTFISFNYGQRHKKELEFAAYWANKTGSVHHIVDLSGITGLMNNSALTNPDIEVPDGNYDEASMKVTVVPNRNAVMISIATALAVNIGAETVMVGVHAGDHAVYPDCRPEFINSMDKAMYAGNEGLVPVNFSVHAPFIKMSKADICALGAQVGVDFSMTWSCYKGGHHQCSRCGTCSERIEAFVLAGIEDPTVYADPANVEELRARIRRDGHS